MTATTFPTTLDTFDAPSHEDLPNDPRLIERITKLQNAVAALPHTFTAA
jgi:hypothetical protein